MSYFYLQSIQQKHRVEGEQILQESDMPKEFVEMPVDSEQYPVIYIIGDKLAYVAVKNGKEFIRFDGEELGRKYDGLGGGGASLIPGFAKLVDVNGKLAFIARKGREFFVVYDGQEIEKHNDVIDNLIGLQGGVGFTLKENNKTFPVTIINGERTEYHYDGYSLENVNGKLAFTAKLGDRAFVVYDGKEYGKEYARAENPKEINGKLTFSVTASENRYEHKQLIIYDGKEIGREYRYIRTPFSIGGKLGFYVDYTDKEIKKVFVVDGQEIGDEYDDVHSPTDINGKLAFIAEKDGKFFVVYDGKKVSDEYKKINGTAPLFLREILGRLVFIVTEQIDSSEKRTIYYDGRRLELPYENIYQLFSYKGKFAFIGEREGQLFIVIEK